jgi:hypothetical protein
LPVRCRPLSELVDFVSGLAALIGVVVAVKQSGAAEPSDEGGARQDRPVPPAPPAVAPPPAVPSSPYATSRFAFRHQVERDFLGRETELDRLDHAWAAGLHIVSIVAWGGVGKTALVAHWLHTRFFSRDFRPIDGLPGPAAYFDWSFYDWMARRHSATSGTCMSWPARAPSGCCVSFRSPAPRTSWPPPASASAAMH